MEIPFVTIEGYKYLIKFSEISTGDKDYGVPIVDISISLLSKDIEINSFTTLSFFTNTINEYLSKNDVIIYYYCDRAPIQMRESRNQKMSPQEYRSRLFKTMFINRHLGNYYFKEIIISDPNEGDHFLALVSNISNQEIIENIGKDLWTWNK